MEEWYKKYRKKLYSHKDFRRERYKRILIFIGVVILIFIAYTYDFLGIKTTIKNVNLEELKSKLNDLPQTNLSSVSIGELKKNPENYSGKMINISGMLNSRVGGYSLDDEEGNWIWLESSCLDTSKKYDYNSIIYTAEGIYIPPKQKEYLLDPMVGKEYQSNFRCSYSIY